MNEKQEMVVNIVFVCIATAAALAWLAYAAMQPYFEYRAYNRVTGASKNYWDAVVLELKVPKSAGDDNERR